MEDDESSVQQVLEPLPTMLGRDPTQLPRPRATRMTQEDEERPPTAMRSPRTSQFIPQSEWRRTIMIMSCVLLMVLMFYVLMYYIHDYQAGQQSEGDLNLTQHMEYVTQLAQSLPFGHAKIKA